MKLACKNVLVIKVVKRFVRLPMVDQDQLQHELKFPSLVKHLCFSDIANPTLMLTYLFYRLTACSKIQMIDRI